MVKDFSPVVEVAVDKMLTNPLLLCDRAWESLVACLKEQRRYQGSSGWLGAEIAILHAV